MAQFASSIDMMMSYDDIILVQASQQEECENGCGSMGTSVKWELMGRRKRSGAFSSLTRLSPRTRYRIARHSFERTTGTWQ